jgi:hypothetical protein
VSYYSSSGPRVGPYLLREAPRSIGVMEVPDDRTPIGMAAAAGRDEDGVALWRLTVRKVELGCRWIVVDREFRLVK